MNTTSEHRRKAPKHELFIEDALVGVASSAVCWLCIKSLLEGPSGLGRIVLAAMLAAAVCMLTLSAYGFVTTVRR